MKQFGRLLLALLMLTTAFLLYAFAVYPAEYVLRVLTWGDADVQDHQRFPAYEMAPGQRNFEFVEAPDEGRVRTLFEAEPVLKGALDQFLAEKGTQAFIVIQDDRILYEQYFNGHGRESLVTSFSEAKSFTSALIGIAIDEGYIQSVAEPITNYLPELAERDPRFGEITIRDLLKMASGIRYVEYPFFGGDDVKTYYYPDLRQLALTESRIVEKPGQAFHYNNYHPLLLGLILERATGTPVAEYLEQKIWRPLGMEYGGSWSLDSEGSGFPKMESGINGRAIDFARFGRLFLAGGEWEGEEIIPPAWVAESTGQGEAVDRERYYPDNLLFTEMQGYYGYMWWGVPRADGPSDFTAIGNHGQYLYISPAKRLIIVRHGERYGIPIFEWVKLFAGVADRF